MEISPQNHRLVLITPQDCDAAWEAVAKKENLKSIDKKREFYGILAERVSGFYMDRILRVLQFRETTQHKGYKVEITALQNVELLKRNEQQSLGDRAAYKDADFVFVNRDIESAELDPITKEKTRFGLEIKSRSCRIQDYPGRSREAYWDRYITSPPLIYPLNITDYNQLAQHRAGLTIAWGLYVENPTNDKPAVQKAYCYMFSNEEILAMLYTEAESVLEALRGEKNEGMFMRAQEERIWNDRMVRQSIKEKREKKMEDPFYRIYYELRQTEYASRPKFLTFHRHLDDNGNPLLDEEGKETTRVEERVLENTRESIRSEESIIREAQEHYPEDKLIKLLREGREPRGGA